MTRLRVPDPVEKRRPALVTSLRMFFPLLGGGVRVGVSVHFNSMNRPIQGAESGFLRLGRWVDKVTKRWSFGAPAPPGTTTSEPTAIVR